MKNFRLILVLILLLPVGSTNHVFSSEISYSRSDLEITSQLSVDFQELSTSRISTLTTDILKNRFNLFSPTNPAEENVRDYSKSKAYFSINRFIEPGLSLSDIIFPFHIFL